MHGITGLDDAEDFLRVAVDDGNLPGVTQRHREEVVDIAVVLRFGRAIFGRNQDFPGRLHLRHAEFRRHRRFLLQEARHDVDLLRRHLTGGAPVRHTGRRAVGDQGLEVFRAFVERDVRSQRLAGGSLAQDAMAAGATFEIQLRGRCELGFGKDRSTGRCDLARFAGRDRRRRALVLEFALGRADVALAGGTVGLAEFGTQCGNFLDADGGEVVAPGAEHVGHRRGEVFVGQVAEARHHAVVLDAVDRDRALEPEQCSGEDFLAIALQVIGPGQWRKCARQALAIGLVACGAVGGVDAFAFCHEFCRRRDSRFGVMNGGI